MDFSCFGVYQKEAETSCAALREASAKSIACRRLLDESTSFRKPDGSPVTVFDHVVQAIILDIIFKAFPDDAIIAEESLPATIKPEFLAGVRSHLPQGLNVEELFSHVKNVVPLGVTRHWAIDPIDGTYGFTQPGGHYANAIALIIEGNCAFSAIAWPTATPLLTGFPKPEPLFCFAALGLGAFVTNGLQPLSRLSIPSTIGEFQLFPPILKPRAEDLFRQLTQSLQLPFRPLKLASMAKAISLVLGIGNLYVRMPIRRGCETTWDIAPIVRLVEEAGGCATTGDGKPIRFSRNAEATGSASGLLFSNQGADFHRRLVRAYLTIFSPPE
jgi:3'(2'), 5'-bisphosphate nucleotidase